MNQLRELHFFKPFFVGRHSAVKINNRIMGVFIVNDQCFKPINDFFIVDISATLAEISNCMKYFYVMKQ